MSKPVIIIEIQSGAINGVSSNLPDEIQVIVIDYDAKESGEDWAAEEPVNNYRPGDDEDVDEALKIAGVEI